MKLQHKTALVTGGTSGIGAAIAKRFSAEGARVIVTGTRPETVAAVDYAEAIVSDTGDLTAIMELLKFAGPLDILVVNAGIARRARLPTITETHFDEHFRTNVRGPLFLMQQAAETMNSEGSIVLISSLAAIRGMPDLVVYGASKAALRAVGLSLSMELAPRGIRVNTITPNAISTPIRSKMGDGPPVYPPLGRFGSADEVASAALYFASDESRYVTGSELIIDGGKHVLGRT